MKSICTEASPSDKLKRGRLQPIKRKEQQKSSKLTSENENNRSILDFFSPPRSSANINDETKRSGSTPRRRKNPLANLESNLSPKYIGFSTPTSSEKRRSRYRLAKLNDSDSSHSFFRSSHELIGCVRRTTISSHLSSPQSPEVSKRNDLSESPIEKLLRKNRSMKYSPNPPNLNISVKGREEVMDVEEEVQSIQKNCVVRLQQIPHELVVNNSPTKDTRTKARFIVEAENVKTKSSAAKEICNEEIVSLEDEVTPYLDGDVSSKLGNDEEITSENIKIITKSPVVDVASTLECENPLKRTEENEVTSNKENKITSTKKNKVPATNDEEVASIITEEKKDNAPTIGVDSSKGLRDRKIVKNLTLSIDDDVTSRVGEDTYYGLREDNNNGSSSGAVTPISDAADKNISKVTFLKMPDDGMTEDEVLAETNLPHENAELKVDLENAHENQLMNLHETKFSNDDLLSVKSPSTFSVDSAKGSSLDNDLNWVSIETGDLFWGQIFQFAYWPCMVCPDPEGKTISANENRGQNQHVMIHVRFFADNGRRSWVKRDNLMSYSGLDVYMRRMNEAEQKYGKKSQKYKVFMVSKGKAKLWNQAIQEADLIDSTPIEGRLKKFFLLLEEVKVCNNLERKRRQSLLIHSSTSDLSSMFDSNDNLYLKHAAGKRDRSPTPVSPAFSPLGPKNTEKRIKLDHNNTRRSSLLDEMEMNYDAQGNEVTATANNELERMENENIYNDSEFKKFASAMRSFVFENSTDKTFETVFMSNVRRMWALKHIALRNQIDYSPEVKYTLNGVKRLSERIRNISIQRSLPSTPVQTNVQQVKEISTVKPKREIRPIEEVIDDIFQLDNKYLFRDISKEPICKECLQRGPDLVKCSMNCQTYVHTSCSADCPSESVPTPFMHITGDLDEELEAANKAKEVAPVICKQCFSGEAAKCFVCKSDDMQLGELARCSNQQCCKFYHEHCLKYWPQAKLTKSAGKLESLRCPAHVCHTCVSDDPKGKFLQIEKSKLTKCIKCPATYHMDSTCIPAGSELISPALIICPRHSKHQDVLVNVNWCFICVSGGNLVCCETCPTAVHAECLKIPIADEGYICEECETGRMPLYGEMVWAKLSTFRWWPSIILPPTEVPLNLVNKAHNQSEFVIRFFGTNDHAWIGRKRVYLYQEGDCSEPPKNYKKGLDFNYTRGVEEAKRIAEIIKQKKLLLRTNDKKQRVSPLPYVKIRSNRAVPPIKLLVDLENISKCECDKDSENPCAQDSGCLNRVLYNECNPKICPAGERCQNQLFEKKLYPKCDVMYMNEKGFGLISLEPISAGTFVIEYVGEVIDDAEFRRRISQKEQERDENFYFLTLEKDYIIDAGPKGNLARFMNHSCEPNCETQKWNVNGLNRIGLFAIKDIPVNTELTFNYFWDELLGNEKKSCHCGAQKCAGLIGGKYKEPAKIPQLKIKPQKRRMTNAKLKSPKKNQNPKSKETTKKRRKRTKPEQPQPIDNNNTTSISIADSTIEENNYSHKQRPIDLQISSTSDVETSSTQIVQMNSSTTANNTQTQSARSYS